MRVDAAQLQTLYGRRDVMADANGVDATTQLWEWIKTAATFLVAAIGWIVQRQIKRIDKIEESYVSKDLFNNSMDSLSRDIKSGFDRISSDVRNTNSRIDAMLMQDRKKKED